MPDCLFCRMVEGEVPIDKLYEDDLVLVVLDINPRAPVHFMVIPKEHIPTAKDIKGEHGPVLSRMLTTANQVAKDEGVYESGYRLAFNVFGVVIADFAGHFNCTNLLHGHKWSPLGD